MLLIFMNVSNLYVERLMFSVINISKVDTERNKYLVDRGAMIERSMSVTSATHRIV